MEGQETAINDGGQTGVEQAPTGGDVGGGTLLTKPEPADPATGTGGNAEPKVADVKAEPASDYTLAFGPGIEVDTALLGSFKSTAKELQLNNDQAQKLASLYEKHVSDSTKASQEAQEKMLSEAQTGWESEIMKRPGFKQEVASARRVLAQFGTPELNEIMDQSRLGSHPVFFEFVAKVGDALAEPNFKGDSAVGDKKSAAKTLYPNMA